MICVQLISYGTYIKGTMVIAIVSCGKQRVEQTMVTLKSAIMFTNQRLHFVVMADDDNKTELTDRVRPECSSVSACHQF